MALIPVQINIFNDIFDIGLDASSSETLISPLTQIVKRNDTSKPKSVQFVMGNNELEITLTAVTFWTALKSIGGMLSLMFIYAGIAGCRHINQFNESLKKSYYRVTRHLRKDNGYKITTQDAESDYLPTSKDPESTPNTKGKTVKFQEDDPLVKNEEDDIQVIHEEDILSISDRASFLQEMSHMPDP